MTIGSFACPGSLVYSTTALFALQGAQGWQAPPHDYTGMALGLATLITALAGAYVTITTARRAAEKADVAIKQGEVIHSKVDGTLSEVKQTAIDLRKQIDEIMAERLAEQKMIAAASAAAMAEQKMIAAAASAAATAALQLASAAIVSHPAVSPESTTAQSLAPAPDGKPIPVDIVSVPTGAPKPLGET